MDFGSLICKPQKPLCEECPLAKDCYAYATDMVKDIPRKVKRAKKINRTMHFIWITDKQERVYIEKREAGDIWQGLHQPATTIAKNNTPLEEIILHKLDQLHLIKAKILTLDRVPKKHILTHQNIFWHLHVATTKERTSGGAWKNKDEISQLAFPRPLKEHVERWLNGNPEL